MSQLWLLITTSGRESLDVVHKNRINQKIRNEGKIKN